MSTLPSQLAGQAISENDVLVSYPVRWRYTYAMADDAVLDEIQDHTKEAGQRLRASLTLLHSQGMIDDADYRELVSRLSTSLAMVEAAYMEARRRG